MKENSSKALKTFFFSFIILCPDIRSFPNEENRTKHDKYKPKIISNNNIYLII